jgi:hypothetical protein
MVNLYVETSEYFFVELLSVGVWNLNRGRSVFIYAESAGDTKEGVGKSLVVAEAFDDAEEFPPEL